MRIGPCGTDGSTELVTMQTPYNVLVFPGGTEIGLEIWKSLADCKEVNLFSASANVINHAPFVFANHFTVPFIHEENCIEELNQIIVNNKISHIFPAFDDIIVFLARNAEKLKAKIISSPLQTCLTTRSKKETYRLLEKDIPTPAIFDGISEVKRYPVFVKPDRGQGSQGACLVRSKLQLVERLSEQQDEDLIISEYLEGKEYTIDCFTDREKGLLFCGGRERIQTKNGISVSSKVVESNKFHELASKIAAKLEFHGAWFFQLKEDSVGVLNLLEIGPRIAGTMALHRALGINFSLLSLYENERKDLLIMKNPLDIEINRALTNRYKHNLPYNLVYVDLDDTLIIRDKLNLNLIRFLYQCLNKNVKIILITKHRNNLDQTLKKYRIADLFDEIIHVAEFDEKYKRLQSSMEAIFIDDSFSEREKVAHHTSSMTFDSSMLELLAEEMS